METSEPLIESPAAKQPALSLWGMLDAATALACFAALVGFLARLTWFAELASHFRLQYAVSLLLAAAVYSLGKRWKRAGLAAAFSLLNAAQFLPVYFGGDEAAAAENPWRALVLNVHTANQDHGAVIDLIRSEAPDLIVLEEVNKRWARSLISLREDYPHYRWQVREDNFGIGLLSRVPLDSVTIEWIGIAQVPTVVALLEVFGKPLTVIGTHPLPPQQASLARMRDDQLSRLAEYVRGVSTEVLLLGDLNVSPFSPAFDLLLEGTDLRDSRVGFGVHPTWPAGFMLPGIPLDHCLVSSGLVVHDRRVGPYVGADHLPVIVDLEWRGTGANPED